MFNLFKELETNLGRAGLALALAFLGTIALSFALKELGADPVWGMLYALIAFSFSAWFMSQAAQKQGRSPLLYGLATLFPPSAILAFASLYNRDLQTRA
jgi:Na+/H+ antiporter NhaC